MPILNSSFYSFMRDGMWIGLFWIMFKFEKAGKLITNDIIKVLVKIRIFFQDFSKFGIGDNDDRFTDWLTLFIKIKKVMRGFVYPIHIITLGVIVIENLLFAVGSINQIDQSMCSVCKRLGDCSQGKVRLAASCGRFDNVQFACLKHFGLYQFR